MGKIYEYRVTITIGDTNILQNVYFENYFRFQGICRELFVRDVVDDAIKSLQGGLILMTKSASCNYIKDFYLFDRVLIQMQFTRVGRASVDLRFRFLEETTMQLRAEANQTIVFAGANHKICRIPLNFKKAILEYSDEIACSERTKLSG